MSVNWAVFKTNMTSYLSSYSARDTKDFVKYFLTQYDLALRTGTNNFGNVVLKTNLEFALNGIEVAMKLQKFSDDVDKTFDIISKAISTTLLTTKLLPVPPIPPTVSPNFASPIQCSILFPGDIRSLKKDLKSSLSDNPNIKTVKMAVDLLQLALQKHLMTVGGLYFGMILIGPGMIPAPPIPWLGIR